MCEFIPQYKENVQVGIDSLWMIEMGVFKLLWKRTIWGLTLSAVTEIATRVGKW